MDLHAAMALARGYMSEHGLTAQGWHLALDGAVSRCGSCHHGRRRITLSRHYIKLNGQPEIVNTILHEIAHALNGNMRDAHGPAWRAIARRIGSSGERCASRTVAMPPKRFVGECEKCHTKLEHNMRPSGGGFHTPCGGRIIWRRNVPGGIARALSAAGVPSPTSPIKHVGGYSAHHEVTLKAKYPHLVSIGTGPFPCKIKCVKCGGHRLVKPQDLFQCKLCVACKEAK